MSEELDVENMSTVQINVYLREHGYEPEQIALRGKVFIGALIETLDLRSKLDEAEQTIQQERQQAEVYRKQYVTELSGADALRAQLAASAQREQRLTEKIERADDELRIIENWAKAYPLEVFPEPDFKKAHALLQAGGMTLDAISASNMRHVVKTVSEIAARARAALAED